MPTSLQVAPSRTNIYITSQSAAACSWRKKRKKKKDSSWHLDTLEGFASFGEVSVCLFVCVCVCVRPRVFVSQLRFISCVVSRCVCAVVLVLFFLCLCVCVCVASLPLLTSRFTACPNITKFSISTFSLKLNLAASNLQFASAAKCKRFLP